MKKRPTPLNLKGPTSAIERARHAELNATPILFRPTWAEAYASRFRRAVNQHPRLAALSPPEATADDLSEEPVTFSFTAPDTNFSIDDSEITCPDEALRRTAVARIMIIRETGEALRVQANISARAARYLFN